MTRTLLQTKLYIPPTRANLVARPELLKKLDAVLTSKLALISAPAGFGKTTLISTWIDQAQSRNPLDLFTWITLDQNDNDAGRFFTYFAAALNRVKPSTADPLLELLSSGARPANETLLVTLINILAAMPSDVILVLDDYQFIEEPEIHQGMIFLLDHLPPQLHLILVTRVDPPLPLARMRSRGEMVEIRDADLRFNQEETAVFLNEIMGLGLPMAAVTALETRTEGWISGLQMAAISLRGQEDADTFVRAFTGSDRFVLDYLTEEVLQQQSAGIQEFLLKTSILNRLAAPLCQELLGSVHDPVAGIQQAQERLEYLEQSNLFIIPLDNKRHWYRYHHLFADLLRNQLQRKYPLEIADLHRRAARWYAAQGEAREAVHHALAAEDYRLAGQIIQDNWRRLFHQGWISTTLQWLESLPPQLLQQLPPLSIAFCWSLALRGDYGRIPFYLSQAETAFKHMSNSATLPKSSPEYDLLQGQFFLLRGVIARAQGDPAEAIKQAQKSLAIIRKMEGLWESDRLALGYGATTIQLGYSYIASGDLKQAEACFSQALPYNRTAGNFLAMCACVFELARLWLEQDRLAEAETICLEALSIAKQPDYAGWPAFFLAHLALADLLCASDQTVAAEVHVQQGLDLGHRSGQILYLARGYLIAEQIYIRQDKTVAAQQAYQEAVRLLQDVGLVLEDLSHPAAPVIPQAANKLVEPLTEREQDVLRLIAAGLSNREIAEELSLSPNTIKTHSKSLYSKLDVHTRTQAILRARQLELI